MSADGRCNANANARNSDPSAPNGNAPIELTAEDLSNDNLGQAGHVEQTGQLTDTQDGAVNEAFDGDQTDTSGGEGEAAPSHSPSFPKKSLRWTETVETIPDSQNDYDINELRQNGACGAQSDAVSGDNVLVITENDKKRTLSGPPQSEVWVTPSSRFLEQDKQGRTSPCTQYSATPPPSRSEQHSPYADHAGNVVSQTTHSNNRVISAADLYPVGATGGKPGNQDTHANADQIPSVDGQARATSPFSLTRTAEGGVPGREWKETEEQNRVTFVCPADEDEQEDISGSKEFVCIRL